jgi:hypothetical protein
VGTPAETFQWMAFDPITGLRNELLQEQVLQSDLGSKVESQGARRITLVRLEDLFRPVLKRDHIDLVWDSSRQLAKLFENDAPFLALTQSGRYATLVSRLALLTETVKPLAVRTK